MSKGRLIIVLVILAVVLITTFGLKSSSSAVKVNLETKPEIGYLAPDFTLKDLQGNTVKLSDFRGKPVFLNFWASWCPPCKQEIPEIQKFYEANKDKVAVLAVNITFNDRVSDVLNILKSNNANYPVLLDTNGTSPVADAYQVDGIPASFFIDKDGVIREIHVGGMTVDMLKAAINKAL